MEQEKKTRFRPTVTEYKALRQELEELKEKYRLQLVADERLAGEVKELRDELSRSVSRSELESQIEGTSMLVGDCDAWREKYAALEQSHVQLRDELERVKKQRDELSVRCAAHETVIRELRSRSFLRRIFNR